MTVILFSRLVYLANVCNRLLGQGEATTWRLISYRSGTGTQQVSAW